MQAGGAKLRGFGAFVEVSAVDAAPDHDAVALEYAAFGKVFPEVEVALFVLFFGVGYFFPEDGDLLEAFLSGDAGKFGVEGGPLFVFAGGGGFEVIEGGADDASGEGGGDFQHAAFEEAEEAFGVFFFVVGGFFENLGNLDQAFFARGGGEEGVAIARLRFAGERNH